MYSVYADDICIYNDILPTDETKLVNPKLILEGSAAGSFTVSIPPTNIGYNIVERMTTDIIVKKHDDIIWMGRVLSESKDFWNNRNLTCEGDLAFFNDSTQPPFAYEGYNIRGYIEAMLNIHNGKVKNNRRFRLGVVTVEIDENKTFYTNYEKTIEKLNELVDEFGGYMRIRYEGNTRYLDYLEECPNVSRQTIDFGVNLLDFTRSWDLTEFATVIVPLGARLDDSPIEELDAYLTVEELTGSIYVESQEAVEVYGWIEKTVTWDDVTDPAVLLELAREYLSEIQFDNMTIELSALDLHYLNADVDAINLLDEIRVISHPHGLNHVFPVTKLEIPLDSPEKTQFKLGDDIKINLTDVNNKTNTEILEKIEDLPKAHNILREAKENATEIMNLATNGYITITKDEYGSEALYISSERDYQQSEKLWKWNINGLGYSDDGGQTFGLAMTMDGSIVADYITTGVLNGDLIRTGVITDSADAFYWDPLLDDEGDEILDDEGNIIEAHSRGQNVVFDLDAGKLTIRRGSIYLGAYDRTSNHYMFEVDENGNVYAGSGTFAGRIYGYEGAFYGMVQASDFRDQNGRSMWTEIDNLWKFKSEYLSLYGLEVLDYNDMPTFTIDGAGTVTLKGSRFFSTAADTSYFNKYLFVGNAGIGFYQLRNSWQDADPTLDTNKWAIVSNINSMNYTGVSLISVGDITLDASATSAINLVGQEVHIGYEFGSTSTITQFHGPIVLEPYFYAYHPGSYGSEQDMNNIDNPQEGQIFFVIE